MKKVTLLTGAVLALLFSCNFAKAQAWDRDSKVLALGFGASQFFHIDNYYYNAAPGFRAWYWPVTGQINFQGEFAVHKYVGLGFTTGLGGRGRRGDGDSRRRACRRYQRGGRREFH